MMEETNLAKLPIPKSKEQGLDLTWSRQLLA